MASGATVKLGVEGISQFKNNMNQAKQAVKTLDAQLTLTEKQFKATGDAESYMTEKSELLKAKLEQQKTMLANAEKALQDMQSKGIDRASKAYQDMYRNMINAKAAMIDTQNEIDGVGVSSDATASDVKEMNNELKNVGQGIGWQNVTTAFDNITAGVEKAAKKVIGFGKQVVNTMLDAGSWADDLNTRADYFMMEPEELQRAEKTARLIDTSVESIVGAQRKLKKALGKQDEEAFGALVELMGEGYDPSGKDWEDVFWDAGEALMRFTKEEEREVYAQRLFGKSWNELIPLFKTGREEYEEMNASWSVVSKESIDALQQMQNEYDTLMANWETFKYEALAQFATPMRQALEIVNEQLGKVQDWLKSEEGQAFVENILKAITEGMKWIVDHKEDVVNALKWIVVGWAGIKLTGGALHILQLVNGVKNLHLFGGSSGAAAGAAASGSSATAATGATGTAAASGTATTVGGGVKSFLGTVAKTVPYMLPALVAAGSAMDIINFTTESLEKGEASISKFQELQAKYGGVSGFEGYSGLYGYMHLRQSGADPTAMADMDAFAKHYAQWLDDEVADPLLDKMLDLMSPEEFDDFIEAMELYSKNAQMDPDELQTEVWGPMQVALDKMEEAMDDLSGDSAANQQSSSDMSAAAGQLKGLPGVIEGAIMSGMSGIKIYIDGQQAGNVLTPYVNSGMAGILAGLTK